MFMTTPGEHGDHDGELDGAHKSTVTASADYRKSPFLLTQNALQGQAAGSR